MAYGKHNRAEVMEKPMPLTASERLVHSTARIACYDANGLESSGTAFWFKFNVGSDGSFLPALITNKHVVVGAAKCVFHVTECDRSTGRPKFGSHFSVSLNNGEADCIMHPDPSIDLAMIPLSNHYNQWIEKGIIPCVSFFEMKDIIRPDTIKILPPMIEIVMTGYPIGIWDSVNNMPILRKGSSATDYSLDYEGRPEFIIDAACFPGSSGSPVCLVSEGSQLTVRGGFGLVGSHFSLLGILYAGPQFTAEGDLIVTDIPTSGRPISITRIPSNLGFCIKANQLLAFEQIVVDYNSN